MTQLMDHRGTAEAEVIAAFLAGSGSDADLPAPEWGPIGEEVFHRTYARTIVEPDGRQRLESWAEAVRRVVLGNLSYAPESTQLPNEAVDLFQLIYNFGAIPAGRHLWVTGTEASHFSRNCWVSGWSRKTSDHVRFLAARLFEGGGVGSNYSADLLKVTTPIAGDIQLSVICRSDHLDIEAVRDAAGNALVSEAPEGAAVLVVEDTREGWVDAWCQLIDLSTEPGSHRVVFDLSGIRPHGAPLKTFGGNASGPAPLARSALNLSAILSRVAAEGRRLNGIDAMEIDHEIASAVVAGGARRSARMSLMHWEDPQILAFIASKADPSRHWSTNISVEIDAQFADALDEGDPHAERVLQLVATGMAMNGEPGFVNSSLHSRGERQAIRHTNPCVTKDTWIQTVGGLRQVGDLLDRGAVTLLVNDEQWETTPEGFFQTGVKPVVELDVDGTALRLTHDHLVSTPGGWRRAGDLTTGDVVDLTDSIGNSWGGDGTESEGYLLGHLVGDGYFRPPNRRGVPGAAVLCAWRSDAGSESTKAAILAAIEDAGLQHRADWGGWNAHGPDKQELRSTAIRDLAERFGIVREHKGVSDEVVSASSGFIAGFLRGLFDTDGHVEGSSVAGGVSVRLDQSDAAFLGRVRVLLLALGIRSVVRGGHLGGYRSLPGGTYRTKDCYRLTISGEHVERFSKIIGFNDSAKAAKLDASMTAMTKGFHTKPMVGTVRAVQAGGIEPVFDCTVPGLHAFVANGTIVHNCGEASLQADVSADGNAEGESCNLGSVNLERFGTDYAAAAQAFQLMARFLYRATLNPHADPSAGSIERSNRRIGVGVLGLQGWVAAHGRRLTELPSSPDLVEALAAFRRAVRSAADDLADALGTPHPIKVTAVAPTGTIAQLCGTTPGIHPVFARRFLRRVRYADHDPRLTEMIAAGHTVVPDIYADRTSVVEFPVVDRILERFPEHLIEESRDISIVDFCRLVATVQESFCGENDGQGVSATGHVPVHMSPSDLASAIRPFVGRLKGLTVFPDLSRPLSPYEAISAEEYERRTAAGDLAEVGDSNDGECVGGACPIR
jgi:ribonucleotide reductase alpha subunit